MKEKTTLGIIGLGSIAQVVYLPILKKMQNVEIKAVSEIKSSRLNSLADKYNIKNRYVDYKDLLEKEELDAVIIATPTNTHAQIAIDALNAGKNLLIEKPVARSVKETQLIYEAAQRTGLKVMVGMNLRFRPDAMLLKSLIKNGEIGEIFYVRCGWIRKQSSQQSWFWQKEKAGGGVLFDLGILLLDLTFWLLDFPEVKTVSVQKFCNETETVEDSAVGLLRLGEKTVINFEVSWSLHSDTDSLMLSAYGKGGTAHLNPLKLYRRIGSGHLDYTPATSGKGKNLYKKSYENELKHFIGILRDELPLIASIGGALQRMKILEALYKSAELNQEISLQ